MKPEDKTLAEEILIKKIFPCTTETTLDGSDFVYRVNPERHKLIIEAMHEYHEAKFEKDMIKFAKFLYFQNEVLLTRRTNYKYMYQLYKEKKKKK